MFWTILSNFLGGTVSSNVEVNITQECYTPPPPPPPVIKGIWDNTRFGLTYVWTEKKFFHLFISLFISSSHFSSFHLITSGNQLKHLLSLCLHFLWSYGHFNNDFSAYFYIFYNFNIAILKGIWDNTRFGLTYVQTQKIFFPSLHLIISLFISSSHFSSHHFRESTEASFRLMSTFSRKLWPF